MDTNKQSLLKIFSVLLKKKASEKEPVEAKTISPVLIKYFSRKELVEMVSQTYEQQLPEGTNLLELENEEILGLIESDYQIIIYMCEKWLKEEREHKQVPQTFPENADSSADENQPAESSIPENTEEQAGERTGENSSSDSASDHEIRVLSGESSEKELSLEAIGNPNQSTSLSENFPGEKLLPMINEKDESFVLIEPMPESGNSEIPENEHSEELVQEEETVLSDKEQDSPEKYETASVSEDANHPETENEEPDQNAGSSFSAPRLKNKNKKQR